MYRTGCAKARKLCAQGSITHSIIEAKWSMLNSHYGTFHLRYERHILAQWALERWEEKTLSDSCFQWQVADKTYTMILATLISPDSIFYFQGENKEQNDKEKNWDILIFNSVNKGEKMKTGNCANGEERKNLLQKKWNSIERRFKFPSTWWGRNNIRRLSMKLLWLNTGPSYYF